MIFTQDIAVPAAVDCAAFENGAEPPAIIEQCSPLDLSKPMELNLNTRYIPLGDQYLCLEKDLVGEVYFSSGVLRIKGWGIDLALYEEANSDWNRAIARKFLDLHSKAEADLLSEEEKPAWISIISQVNYQRFSAERSPEVYLQGKLLAKELDGWKVQWHDGTIQFIRKEVSRPLDLVDLNQHFGAIVKFGLNNEIVSLTSVSFIADIGVTAETLWDSWPKATS